MSGNNIANIFKAIGNLKEKEREGIIKAAEPLFNKGIDGRYIGTVKK